MPSAPLMQDVRISEVPLTKMVCRPHYPVQGGTSFPVDATGAIKVKVRVNVMEIVAINQIEETFKAVFVIIFHYVDPGLGDFQAHVKFREDGRLQECFGRVIGCPGYDSQACYVIECKDGLRDIRPCDILGISQPDWNANFFPNYSIMNVVSMPEEIFKKQTLEYCSSAGGHVSLKYKFLAEFSQRLELKDMPFDRQLLRMKFVADNPLYHMQFSPLQQEAGYLKGGKRSDVPDAVPVEWRVSEKRAILQVMKPMQTHERARFDVLIHVERKPGFYVWNTFFILFLLTTSSTVAYLMEPSDLNGRSSVFLTLLLATVGYKFIVSGWMPIKPYLTILDKYVISSFLFQGMVIAESVFVVWMWCSPIQDDDPDTDEHGWQDGIYNGTYSMRTPPSLECSGCITDVEFWFTKLVFGSWITINMCLLLCPKLAILCVRRCLKPCTRVCQVARRIAERGVCRCDIGLRSWEEIYEQEKTFTPMDVPKVNHPYGVRPLQRDIYEQEKTTITPMDMPEANRTYRVGPMQHVSAELPDLLTSGNILQQLKRERAKGKRKKTGASQHKTSTELLQ